MGKRVCCKLQTPKHVMLQGFAAMGTLYFAIGLNWSFLRHTPALLILLYGLTFFFANYGPNTTTFILPSLVFSPDCRTTLNGVSAAAGKLGALTGATLFEPMTDSFGNDIVMLICAGVAVISFLMTWIFVQMHPTTPNPV
jgi:PHS family inorganic phosphate transporter-like MFS transporter